MTFLKTVESYRQGARTLPGRYYTSPEVFADEQERIFRRHWICIGRDARLAASGDYFVVEIAGESIIVLRDQSGERRAYYNVCRHRGTRLCEAPQGRLSETIQCPYHAWTYALDGRLIGAPHMHEVEGFDKKAYPLHAVALAEWEGFLFANLDPQAIPAARMTWSKDRSLGATWRSKRPTKARRSRVAPARCRLASFPRKTSGARSIT